MRWLVTLALTVSQVSLLVTSCTSIDCPVKNTVYTVYNLYTADEAVDTLRDTLFVFTRRSNGSDTLLLNSGIGLTTFPLAISYSCPEDTLFFVFCYRPDYLSVDTVLIKKDDIPHFESVDCHASFFHRLTAVRSTHNAIDSITINKSFVDYDAETAHFHLYLKDRR